LVSIICKPDAVVTGFAADWADAESSETIGAMLAVRIRAASVATKRARGKARIVAPPSTDINGKRIASTASRYLNRSDRLYKWRIQRLPITAC
jgi:hypothetical protein